MNEYIRTRMNAAPVCYCFEAGITLYEPEEIPEQRETQPPSTSRREPSESSLIVKADNGAA
jgi:hypothetical protein